MNTHDTLEEQPVASTAEHWTDRIARQNRQDTLALAKQYRLRVKYEDEKECKDLFIPGRRGQLYFDDGKLCLTMLNAPVRERSVLEAVGGKLWTGDKSPNTMHLYRGAPAVRCWSKYQETDKRISLCAATLRSSKSRSTATEDPTKGSCPFCVQLMHP